MLDDFGNELDNTESKIDSTMKKMAKVLHMNNGKVEQNYNHGIRSMIWFTFCFRQASMDGHRSFINSSIHCDNFIYYLIIFRFLVFYVN